MKGALQWGKSSRLAELRHVLVRVGLSNGAEGVAEAPPRPTIYGETASSICSIIHEELTPRIVGLTVIGGEESWESPNTEPLLHLQSRLHEVKNNHTAKGSIDIALHAAIAQHRGVSLAQHLGTQQERIRVSYILGMGNRDTVLEEAVRVTDQGVRVLKVKVGRNWNEDIERIVDLQNTLRPNIELYADANETLSSENAASRLEQLAEMGLLYCEEPLPVEQMAARSRLQSGQHLPIIADDSSFSLPNLSRELESGTYDILNIKTARTGYTESWQMLNANIEARKGCMIGSQASAGLGTARAAVFAALKGIDHSSELSFPLKLEEDIIDRPIPIENGYIRLADADVVRVDKELLRSASVEG